MSVAFPETKCTKCQRCITRQEFDAGKCSACGGVMFLRIPR